jgi:hypothetical protein
VNGTYRGGSLSGRSAHGNALDCRIWNELISLRFRPRPGGNRNAYTYARRRRFDGLMGKMANGAGVRGSVGMMMPDSPKRRPQHEREER